MSKIVNIHDGTIHMTFELGGSPDEALLTLWDTEEQARKSAGSDECYIPLKLTEAQNVLIAEKLEAWDSLGPKK